jgi:hypothetical protein
MKATGSRAEVFHGTAKKTTGGLTKDDLFMGKDGHIKSKEMKKRGDSPALKKWRAAVEKARKELKLKKKEFTAITGELLDLARKYYKK